MPENSMMQLRNQYNYVCEVCVNSYHRQYTGINFYKCVSKSGLRASWTCHRCTLSIFPFHNLRNLAPEVQTVSNTNEIFKTLQDKVMQL